MVGLRVAGNTNPGQRLHNRFASFWRCAITETVASIVSSVSTLALSIVGASVIALVIVSGVVIRFAAGFIGRLTRRSA